MAGEHPPNANARRLAYYIAPVIPARDKHGAEISAERRHFWIHRWMQFFTDRFGGAIVQSAPGANAVPDAEGNLIDMMEDAQCIVRCDVPSRNVARSHWAAIRELAEAMLKDLNQHSVFILAGSGDSELLTLSEED